MGALFAKTELLESKIDEYLDHISQCGLLFKEAIRNYVEGRAEEFDGRRQQVSDLENHADELRRDIERQLYVQTLIPESRGDVLGLLEHVDEVINTAKHTLVEFSVERPDIPADLSDEYLELSDFVVRSVEELVMAMRSFFREIGSAPDHIHKVAFWEKEADAVAWKLKSKLFELDLDLAHKIQLGYFSKHIVILSDEAEDVAERLAICAIKRSM
jgi:predicted phosphate transport protein (TIGR00153 family)